MVQAIEPIVITHFNTTSKKFSNIMSSVQEPRKNVFDPKFFSLRLTTTYPSGRRLIF
jgi:hypothetical protein